MILGEIRRQQIFSGGIYSRPEETSGLQILHYVGRNLVVFVVLRDLVTGNLLGEKVVVGLVGVERPDYVVAVAPGVGADAVLGEHSLRIRIARPIQPVPRPALAVAIAGQQFIHDLLIGVRGLVGHESVHFCGCRRQPDHVQKDTSNHYGSVGLSRKTEILFFQFR